MICVCCLPWAHTSDHGLVPLVGVLEEAEFYNIASLVRLVKERIRDNENRTSQVRLLELLRTKPVRAAVCLCCDKDGCLLLGAGEPYWFRVGAEEWREQRSHSPSGSELTFTSGRGKTPGCFRASVCSQACSSPRACTPLPQPS